MKKYLYPIVISKIRPYLKYWFLFGKKYRELVSLISQTLPLTLNNTLELKFEKFQPEGATEQDGTPTPETPVEIKNVKGKNLAYTGWAEDFVSRINDNTKAKLETYDDKNCLFYVSSAGYQEYDTKYLFKINWKENTQYTIQCSILNTGSQISYNYNLLVHYTDGTSVPIFNSYQQNAWLNFKFTTALNKTVKYITSAYYAGQRYLDLDTFMVYEGTEATSYLPYNSIAFNVENSDGTQEQTALFTFEEGQYLAEGGYLADDGIHELIYQFILDGTSGGYNSTENWYYISVSSAQKPKLLQALSNYFTFYDYVTFETNKNLNGFSWNSTILGNVTHLIIRNTACTSQSEYRAWLAELYSNGTPVIAQYELATETITPYTETQQAQWNAIKNLHGYNEQTNISCIGSVVMPKLSIDYIGKVVSNSEVKQRRIKKEN